jgi:hypothetical protein
VAAAGLDRDVRQHGVGRVGGDVVNAVADGVDRERLAVVVVCIVHDADWKPPDPARN